jgi:hypothetical protein
MMSTPCSALITRSRAVHPWAAGTCDDVELLREFHIITPASSAVTVNSLPAIDLDRIHGQRFRMRVDAAYTRKRPAAHTINEQLDHGCRMLSTGTFSWLT